MTTTPPQNNPHPPRYSPVKPRFTTPPKITSTVSLTSTTAFSGSNHGIHLGPNTGTPASSPRRRLMSSRPLTAPANKAPDQVPKIPSTHHQRPKTPRQKQESPPKVQRTPRSAPRPRTLSTLLEPRRISSLSSTCVADEGAHLTVDDGEKKLEGVKGGVTPVKIDKLHFGSSYTPHKSHWVKKALEQLGGDWVREGKITNEQLVSDVFEEKMAVLYELAMAKKHQGIDRLVAEECDLHGKVPPGLRKKKSLGKKKEPEVQKNFPFAEHLNEAVKASMSEALLRIMMRENETTSSTTKKKDRGDATPKTRSPKKEKPKNQDTSDTSNSFERSLKNRRSLEQVYCVDGRLVFATKDKMLSVGGSFVNKFGDSSTSRRRNPSASPSTYFRNTANLMGFLPHEINIRFCKNSRQLIISAARPLRGTENARQVREVIEIPKGLEISKLTVLRTQRGSLIIEEVEVE